MLKLDERNPQILNDFLNYLFNVKNYSFNTIKNYDYDLLSFFVFLKFYFKIEIDIKDFTIFVLYKVKEKDLYAFLVYLNFNKNNSGDSRARKISSIRHFYKWLSTNYPTLKIVNPATNISNILTSVRLPKALSLQQAQSLINIFNITNSIYPLRNNTIITLFLNTGIRLSELSNINIEHINIDDKSIKIIGKGNKQRIVFINETTLNQLLKHLKYRTNGNIDFNSKEPLFISHQNKRLGIDGISDVCKKAFKLANIEEYGYTPHSLRHAAALIIYNEVSEDILLVKEFLGHASISTTQIYTYVDNKNVRKAVDKNPLNNLVA